MTAPGILCIAVGRLEHRARELLAARLALLSEEVRAQSIDEAAKRGLFRRSTEVSIPQSTKILSQHRELRLTNRPIVEKHVEPVSDRRENIAEARRGELACPRAGHVARTTLQKPPHRLRRDQSSIEQRR